MDETKNVIPEEEIKNIISELVAKMGFEGEVEIKKKGEADSESLICNVKTPDSHFLIGQYGVNLESLQHIARIVIRKKIPNKINFTIDVNSYRQEKDDSLTRLANDLAREAINERRAVVLRPMTPYERRLVHLELSKNDQVKTESMGEGEDRRVVIKPADLV